MALVCPTCRATYDDGLTYCPADGSQLRHAEPEPAPTEFAAAVPAPVAAAPPALTPVPATPSAPAASSSSMSGALIGGLVGLVVVLGGILAAVLMEDNAPALREQVVVAGEPFGEGAGGVVEDDASVRSTAIESESRGAAAPRDRALTAQTPRPRNDAAYGPSVVVTDGEGLILRSGPGTGYGVLGKMLPGDVVMANGCESGRPGSRWCSVVYGGVSGYALDAYLAIGGAGQDTESGLEAAFAASEPFGVSAYIDGSAVSYVNLRTRPFASSKRLTRMPLGTPIEVVRCLPYGWSLGGSSIEGRWCFVNARVGGRSISGWASDGALRW